MEIKEHFEQFYEKLRYLGEEVGYDEKTFSSSNYLTVDTHNGLSFFRSGYEEVINDKQVYFKFQGIIMNLVYGNWSNLKYGEIELFIAKDSAYEGEMASVKVALDKLNEYLESHYREYLEKIDAFLYENSRKKHKVKYRPRNILDAKNLKTIYMQELPITNEDIKALQKYPDLFQLHTRSCQIKGDIGCIEAQLYTDFHSTFEDVRTLNACQIGNVFLNKSMFKNPKIYPTSNRIKCLSFQEVDIDYTKFLLLTQFKNIVRFEVNGHEFTTTEFEFLRILSSLKDLTLSGEANTLSFIERLPNLQQFDGSLSIKSEQYIDYLKRKYKATYENLLEIFGERDIINSIIRKNIHELIDRNSFYKKIALPPTAVMKWEDKIVSSNEKEIQTYLKYVKDLPYEKKKEIGSEKQPFLVDTDTSDYYKLLGITTLEDDSFYKTSIVNQFGGNLYCAKTSRYSSIHPIYGANGHLLEEIEYQREKDIKVASYYEGHKSTIVKNDNVVFDYYYNRQISTLDKVEYLFHKMEIHPMLIEKQDYIDLLKKHKESALKIEQLKNKQYACDFYLMSAMTHDYENVSYTIDGVEVIDTLQEVPDPYLDSGYFRNAYHVLEKFRSYDSIKRVIEERFEKENLDVKTREKIKQSIEEYIVDLNEMDFHYKNLVSYDILIEQTLPKYQEIYASLKKVDYLHFYEKDIHHFLDSFHLDSISYDFLFQYILLKQYMKRLSLETELTTLNRKVHILEGGYGVSSMLYMYSEIYDTNRTEDYIDYLKEEERNIILIYEELLPRISKIQELLGKSLQVKREETYKKMMPLMDEFRLDEMKAIKENIPIIAECEGKFAKFVDSLYYYFYKEYPEWISIELLCCPPLPDSFEDEVQAHFVEEHIEHLDGYCMIKK